MSFIVLLRIGFSLLPSLSIKPFRDFLCQKREAYVVSSNGKGVDVRLIVFRAIVSMSITTVHLFHRVTSDCCEFGDGPWDYYTARLSPWLPIHVQITQLSRTLGQVKTAK
jgi:predicted PolB exonuclease-like 3'-5' exonuclease